MPMYYCIYFHCLYVWSTRLVFAKTDVWYLQIFVHLNCWLIFLSELLPVLSQGLAHKQSPEPRTVSGDLKAMLWTDSSLGCASMSACDCERVHVCVNVSYVSAAGRFYQWHMQYTHKILITQFDIQMRGEKSLHFTHLHRSHHVTLKAQSVCTSFFHSVSVWVNKDLCSS